MDFNKKRVVITGASSGIGLAIAKLLISRGAIVYSLDLHKPGKNVPGLRFFRCDVSNSTEVKRALGLVSGKIDILISNAGVMRRGRLLDSSEKDFDLLMGVFIRGSWLLVKYAQPKLRNNAIVAFVSSVHGFSLDATPGVYSLSKASIISLFRILDKGYNEYDFRLIAPGPVDTPLARYGKTRAEYNKNNRIRRSPEFIANLILRLFNTKKKSLLYDSKREMYYFQ